MSSFSDEYINTILDKVAIENNLSKFQYSVRNSVDIAQNYFGVIIPIHLSGILDGVNLNMDLVMKLAPNDERYRVSGAVTKFFLREIFIYTRLLDKFREYQRTYSMFCDFIIPKCFYTCEDYCNEVIVMEDMTAKGYKPPTVVTVDIEHILLSLEAIAKFHALSFILKANDIKLYEKISEKCLPLNEKTNKRFLDILLDRLEKAVSKFKGMQYEMLLNNIKDNYLSYVGAMVSTNATCVCHGDIWIENILFKYQDEKPVSACLIDYQTARVSSPAFDALYLICTSTDQNLRSKHFHQFLDRYYQTFAEAIQSAGLDVNYMYTRKMFDEDLKIIAPSCFIIANTALWLSNGMQQEGHVRSKQILTTDEELSNATSKYRNTIKSLLEDFIDYGYF